MAEDEVKLNKESGYIYIPDTIQKVFDPENEDEKVVTVSVIRNRKTTLMFRKGLPYSEVKKSLQVIIQDLELAISDERKKKKEEREEEENNKNKEKEE